MWLPFFTETTRICPFPAPIGKTCTENVELTDFDGRAVLIEKGTKLIIPIFALHHHPDYYADSDKFNPDRFTVNGSNSSGDAKKLRDAGVFTPFGNGPRSCMGMRWSICFMKAVLCALVENFEFSVHSATDKPSTQTGMLVFSDNTVQLEFKRLQ